ncbi:glycosyltransferase [Streptomyces noursei ZPM]|uniref:Glycosyl transferase n=1 Tax=Streptomyces noursei TaxID=1971 RepID=A0A401R4Q4_STRNR|nr:glycosyltransferase family 2 protein [Streptomyces noursei]AKA05118.1 glycosyltransferase [Streptomyces noursei ZPM]EOT00359.1 glycosyltransferase [Streptomyces noursei CCRC 11814]EXU91560.1 glycosyltransferase [Streptomyces noursei PD-1]UWS73504.1 glycosyltransferase family 2 protein [Streptomyces noursei]GCB92549.1 glycosyl transferase [Streptomyces noursei]
MRRRIIIVTAVHAPSATYLPDAYASLRQQELPDGWEWRWVVQEDGTGAEVAPYVPDDPRVTFRQGRPGGPGVARTIALARAEGEYVKVLDADDQLTPGALARDLAALEGDPGIGWATSRVLDLLPDGSTVGFAGDPAPGPVERGAVLDFWKAHDYRAPVHPASLCVRRDLLLALGGWMALPASEDTGLLLALNAVSRGWFSSEVGLLYRKWPGQVTGQASHTDAGERDARMAVVEARARQLAGLDWRYPDGC